MVVVGFRRMAYVTMDAEIDHGRVIPKEPEKLPPIGRVENSDTLIVAVVTIDPLDR